MRLLAIASAVLLAACTGTPSATEGAQSVGAGGTAGAGAHAGGQGGSGADGGSGGSGATGAAGGATAVGVLDDAGLVARYYVDEAESGVAVTQLEDAAPDPLPLPITYDPDLAFTTVGEQRGLAFGLAGGDGTAGAPLMDTKVMTRLDGGTALTVEVVANVSDATLAPSPLFYMGAGTGAGAWSLAAYTPHQLTLIGEYDIIAQWLAPLEERAVIHAVYDAAASTEPLRCYVDGAAMPRVDGATTVPTSIVLSPSHGLSLGNRYAGGQSIAGTLHYVALYDVAFDAARALAHAQVLNVSDDAP